MSELQTPFKSDYIIWSQLKAGQLIELNSGKIVALIDAKKTRFVGDINGETYSIPKSSAKKVLDGQFNEKYQIKTASWNELKPGDLFALIVRGKLEETIFTFVEETSSRIVGISLVNKHRTRIDKSFEFSKIDLKERLAA